MKTESKMMLQLMQPKIKSSKQNAKRKIKNANQNIKQNEKLKIK
jgi:hypothetical protein